MLQVFVLLLQLLTVRFEVLFALHPVLYLTVFQLDQLSQVFIFLFQRVNFECNLLLLLLCLDDLLLPVLLSLA